MDKNAFLEALKKLKTDNQIDFFAQLPNGTARKPSICAFADQEMAGEAKKVFEEVILAEDFQGYAKQKRIVKKLARKHGFFIAQANIMPQVATFFGRALGPKGKMPNPKAGCIVPPKADLKSLREKLERTIRVSAKTAPVVQCAVGTDSMDAEKVAENASSIYEQIIHHLPNEEENIKSVLLKLTMSSPVRIK
ncbi:50S ribosomal protein L1 [Candidatus Woesearchaeota archaeon]|nr:50S ribosomal protein L1 [Candidatus Woesearchaeota archaeon]